MFDSMSRLVRPVRPNAVSWKREGREVIHHCNISAIDHVSIEIVRLGCMRHTLRLEMLQLAV